MPRVPRCRGTWTRARAGPPSPCPRTRAGAPGEESAGDRPGSMGGGLPECWGGGGGGRSTASEEPMYHAHCSQRRGSQVRGGMAVGRMGGRRGWAPSRVHGQGVAGTPKANARTVAGGRSTFLNGEVWCEILWCVVCRCVRRCGNFRIDFLSVRMRCCGWVELMFGNSWSRVPFEGPLCSRRLAVALPRGCCHPVLCCTVLWCEHRTAQGSTARQT